jgi:4-alpha-glucanotransferase
MQEGQSSPYSALSAMAIDPVFVALDSVDDWIASGAGNGRGFDGGSRVDYATARAAKSRALRLAFQWFADNLWGTGDRRDRALKAFEEREKWWLDDYALFRALHDEHGGRHWREWEHGVRDRNPSSLDAARARLEWETRYYTYLQWIADEQWQRARMEAAPIGLFGDFPFMVSSHSADVWSRQHEFDLDSSVGTPPDAFSSTGQNWGLPAYRWDVVRETDYAWLRERTRRSIELYDGFRIDHIIGFYRTFVRQPDGRAGFHPPDEPAQRAQGERLLTVFEHGGACIIAEDLGTVPTFLRESLAERGIPGMKVMRWERDWHSEGHPFRDPSTYPAVSVATSGTHDTVTLAEWWDQASSDDRHALLAVPTLAASGVSPDAPFSDRTRDALLDALFGAGSRLLTVPLQDIFGWRDRVNTPAVVSEQNWTWRLPFPVEALMEEQEARERAGFLNQLSRKHGRSQDGWA